jgi:hypothetical protein
MFVQSIRLAKSVRPITPVSLRDALEILRLLIYFLSSLLRSISTSVVEMIQTSAHGLRQFLAYLSRFHDSLLSHRIALLLSYVHHLVISISDILAPIPNDILSHILYDWFALAPFHQYTNSISPGEFISDHRSGHSSQFQEITRSAQPPPPTPLDPAISKPYQQTGEDNQIVIGRVWNK